MQKRYVLWWLLLFLLLCNTFVTLNINIAIVSMVKGLDVETTSQESQVVCQNTTFLPKDYSAENDRKSSSKIHRNDGYNWSEAEQNMVLSGYYWLNYFSILPGGILSHKYGSKKVVGYAQLISSVMSSLIPVVAGYGPLAASLIRAFQGALSFMSVPAGLFSIVGNWSPPNERGTFVVPSMIGSSLGMTLGSFLFGYIGQYYHWTYIFHLTSICGIIWSIFWFSQVYDSPAQHPAITVEEKEYIENSLKEAVNKTKTAIPWKGIITSVPLFVCILAVCSLSWAWVAVATYFPKYLKLFYGLNSNEIGIITSVPNLLICLLSPMVGYYGDLVIRKKFVTMTSLRKIYTFIGVILSMIPLIITAFTKCDLILVISCLLVHCTLRTFGMFGPLVVVIDLSPKFCGILEGFTGTTSSICTFVFSMMVNYFTSNYDVEALWKMVFLSTAICAIFTSGIFLILGTSEVQPWNFKNDLKKDHSLKKLPEDQINNKT